MRASLRGGDRNAGIDFSAASRCSAVFNGEYLLLGTGR